jgi:hypothetical protein
LEKSLGITPSTSSIIQTGFRGPPKADPLSEKCGFIHEAPEAGRYILQHMPGPHDDVGLPIHMVSLDGLLGRARGLRTTCGITNSIKPITPAMDVSLSIS